MRCKFLILTAIRVIAFSTKDIFYGSLVFALVCLLTFLLGQGRKAVKYIVIYLARAIVVTFIAAFVGTLIARAIFEKHFVKAGLLSEVN